MLHFLEYICIYHLIYIFKNLFQLARLVQTKRFYFLLIPEEMSINVCLIYAISAQIDFKTGNLFHLLHFAAPPNSNQSLACMSRSWQSEQQCCAKSLCALRRMYGCVRVGKQDATLNRVLFGTCQNVV